MSGFLLAILFKIAVHWLVECTKRGLNRSSEDFAVNWTDGVY